MLSFSPLRTDLTLSFVPSPSPFSLPLIQARTTENGMKANLDENAGSSLNATRSPR